MSDILNTITKHRGRPKGSKNKAKQPQSQASRAYKDTSGLSLKLRGWQPGQSGNPKGRPPKEFSLTAQLEEVLKGKVEDGRTKLQVLAEKVVDKAITVTNPQLVRLVWDRIDGPIREQATISNSISYIKVIHIDTNGRLVESARNIPPLANTDTDIDSISPGGEPLLSEGQALVAETEQYSIGSSHNFSQKTEVESR